MRYQNLVQMFVKTHNRNHRRLDANDFVGSLNFLKKMTKLKRLCVGLLRGFIFERA